MAITWTDSSSFRTANNSNTATGTAYTTEATIEVNFMWLIFPSALYLFISGFFIATVFQTRDLPSWKSNALALLWCREPGDNRLSAPDQMKARGRQAEVHLQDEGDSWRLIET